VVALDRPLQAPGSDEVLFDDRSGAVTAVVSMLAHGHRRIAYVGAEAGLWTVRERLAGYLDAFARAGLEPDRALVRLDCPDPVRAAGATRELLRLPDPPTAVLAMNNLICRGVMRAARAAGLVLDVTAFDPDPDADLFTQPPSTVVNDPEAAGRAAAALLLDRLLGDRRPPRRVVLPATLVVRSVPHPSDAAGVGPAADGIPARLVDSPGPATLVPADPRRR
jgi:LacI family transcriptional regulator